jgi:hypothetical protein
MTTYRSPRRFAAAYSGVLLGWLVVATANSGCSSKSDTEKGNGHAGSSAAGAKPSPDGGGSDDGGASGDGGGIHVGSGGSAGVAGSSCGETALTATLRPVDVLVLLDRSLSMTNAISATDPTTRWEALRKALNGAMTSVSDRVAFGLKLFPDGDASNECGVLATAPEVALGLGSNTVAAIDLAIGQAVPNGGTPIASAVDWATAYFATGPGSLAAGDRVVLLATDGAPNCNAVGTCDASTCVTNIDHPEFTDNLCADFPTKCLDGANAQAKIATLLGLPRPVRTVVVGIPGSDKPAYAAILDDLGRVGGLPNPDPTLDYFAVSADQGVVGLSETLLQITTKLIVSCKLELTSEPPDPRMLNVYVDGNVVAKDATDGWRLDTSTNPPTVVLLGTTCAKLESSGAQSISIKYGCPTWVIL